MLVGTIFQITAHFGLPDVHQQANKLKTLRHKLHNPTQTNVSKESIPESVSHIAMKKKVIH
jgi:hypothetical protein